MKYRDIIGYSDKQPKKEVIPEPPKPSVSDLIKEEFGYKINEGPAYEYESYIKKIDKLYDMYWDSVKDFEKLLKSKGLKKEALTISAYYHKLVGKFDTMFKKLVRKLL
jgi:hypothetical protein|tara:strand:+ start:110 stop:433 length:324 start_codon:yes stop_codon:yes gene_type:complete